MGIKELQKSIDEIDRESGNLRIEIRILQSQLKEKKAKLSLLEFRKSYLKTELQETGTYRFIRNFAG